MIIVNCFALFIASASLSVLVSVSAVKVSTSLGDIRGTIHSSRLEKNFFAFRGIWYAKTPSGELRFQNPQPIQPWTPKTFDATDDGPRCPQPLQSSLSITEESEDCLCLNVYTKNLNISANQPVVIYIHGGRFIEFSGESKRFAGPEILMDQNIVLVTFNYRLGTLGFLATGTADAPGNAGLKDQVMVLKWVHDHIQNFGGDPNSVTLLGYDAGSISIGLHLVSPMSKGLFHRAIAMSGSPLSYWKHPFDQLDSAKKHAKSLKCPTDTVNDMVKCLKEAPVVKNSIEEFGQPVVEKDFGQERFLVEDPLVSFQSGSVYKVPVIVGMTRDEVVDIVKFRLQNITETQLSSERLWKEPPTPLFRYSSNSSRSKEISATLRREYLAQHHSSTALIEPLAKLMSDRVMGFPIHRIAHLLARHVPVFYYQFSYQGRYSYLNYSKGIFHYDDLQYLFFNPKMAPLFQRSDPENTIIERLTGMWAQFASTGDPNYSNEVQRWKPLSLDKENYLDIGEEIVMRNDLLLERFRIWDGLFPLD